MSPENTEKGLCPPPRGSARPPERSRMGRDSPPRPPALLGVRLRRQARRHSPSNSAMVYAGRNLLQTPHGLMLRLGSRPSCWRRSPSLRGLGGGEARARPGSADGERLGARAAPPARVARVPESALRG